MEIYCTTNTIYLVIGAILGFSGALIIESIKRCWEKRDQEEKNKKMLKGLEIEISEGINRCRALIKFRKGKKISFSRIYTAFWDSIKFELSQNLKDVEILRLLHRIYYRFDLVNFNMERDRFGVGAAFAKEYIDEIEKNFKKFISRAKNR